MNNSAATSPFLSRQPLPKKLWSDPIKRMLDILVASVALVLLSPLFVILAIKIKRDSPGPVFFHGIRLGRNAKPFYIHKFRTMADSPESYQGPALTGQDDPRVTVLGKWLRDTKLNELPQFWNVLVGEMSLVGPRPEDREIAASWPEEALHQILSIRPGITSPASVLYHNEEKLFKTDQFTNDHLMAIYLDSILPSKLRLDQLYVQKRTFAMDLDILFWTGMIVVLRLANGSNEPQIHERQLLSGLFFRLSERFLNWFMIDALVSLFAIASAGIFWRTFTALDVGWGPSLLFAASFALLFSLIGWLFGTNRIEWSKARGEDILDLIPPIAIATLLTLASSFLIKNPYHPEQPLYPQALLLLASFFAFLGFVVVRYHKHIFFALKSRWLSRLVGTSLQQQQVLIVGGGESGQFALNFLQNSSYARSFHVAGFVDDDIQQQGKKIQGIEVLGPCKDIPTLVVQRRIDLLLFAIHNINSEERNQLLRICLATGARTVLFPDIPRILTTIDTNQANLEGLTDLNANIQTGNVDEIQALLSQRRHHASIKGGNNELGSS